jgi:alginate O-acetyltransferase complex protein AlgI
MIFSSYYFIFIFFPVSYLVYAVLDKLKQFNLAICWLVICSLYFYAYWQLSYLTVILFSILFNYFIGILLTKKLSISRLSILRIGLIVNLTLLAFYKYNFFFVDIVNQLFLPKTSFVALALPLAISFFTFQQIGYLVDAYRYDQTVRSIKDYFLFVTFFPQLIAGPIVQHHEFFPQLSRKVPFRVRLDNFNIGFTIFVLGLAKKVLIADNLNETVESAFGAYSAGEIPTLFRAWLGILAYTFQIYFDFSGYSNMAVGLGRIFGFYFPMNFNSPYKSKNIVEFWRRWHITLSRMLKSYIYIPLGGNRKGQWIRYSNLFITMFIGGIWHGAGWNFIIWGCLHGVYLIVNQLWGRAMSGNRNIFIKIVQPLLNKLSFPLTFISVMFAWVFFRAENFHGAIHYLKSLGRLQDFSLAQRCLLDQSVSCSKLLFLVPQLELEVLLVYLLAAVVIAFKFPSVEQFMSNFNPTIEYISGTQDQYKPKYNFLNWRPNKWYAIFISLIFVFSLFSIFKPIKFLYFNF